MKQSCVSLCILLFSAGVTNGMDESGNRKSKFGKINNRLRYSEATSVAKPKDYEENFHSLNKKCEEMRDFSLEDDNGNTLLHLAVLSGDAYWVNQYCRYARNNNVNKKGDAPIHLAIRDIPEKAGIQITRLLLDAGADPNLVSGSGTALAIAKKQKKLEIIELLEQKNAQSNQTNYYDLPPRPVLKPKNSFGKFLLVSTVVAGAGYFLYKVLKSRAKQKIS